MRSPVMPGSFSGCTDVLTGKAARNDVNTASPLVSVKGLNVIPDRERRQASVVLAGNQDARGVGIPFHSAHGSPSKQVSAEYASTSACEKSQLIHSRGFSIGGHRVVRQRTNRRMEGLSALRAISVLLTNKSATMSVSHGGRLLLSGRCGKRNPALEAFVSAEFVPDQIVRPGEIPFSVLCPALGKFREVIASDSPMRPDSLPWRPRLLAAVHVARTIASALEGASESRIVNVELCVSLRAIRPFVLRRVPLDTEERNPFDANQSTASCSFSPLRIVQRIS
jgi:hypothetical protein